MFLSLFLLVFISAGGFAITYVFDRDEPLLWRISAGNVIGTAVFGTVCFVAAMISGLNGLSIFISLLLTASPIALLWRKEFGRRALHDWQKAKGKLQGANLSKFLLFAYYLFFLVIFWYFFDRAMIETKDGIFTGASHNLGDLPFHLGAIFGFTDGNNFPPENPSFAGAKFSYPFIADLVSASFVKLGAGVKDAMFVQNVSWAFSLLVITERFVAGLIRGRHAAKVGPLLLFFSGGLGFVSFFGDYLAQSSGLAAFLMRLPTDYTLNDSFVWGNSLITLFITQRSLLLGMPVTIVVLSYLWKSFQSDNNSDTDGTQNIKHNVSIAVIVGMIAGLLPLIHLHSLGVLFVVTGCLLLFRRQKWPQWIAFGVGVAIVALPELLWSLSGSASRTSEFIGWHFGWDGGDKNFIQFWFRNTGLVIPLLIAGAFIAFRSWRRVPPLDNTSAESWKKAPPAREILLFYVPFLLCFVIANTTKLAPWEWDNIKVLIYWFVGSIPLITLALAWMWGRGPILRTLAGICLMLLTLSGALDVWRTVSRQVNIKIFDADAIKLAGEIKQKTPANAVLLNAPTYNSAAVLTGRRSVMRFVGHLWSHGIDYAERESDVRHIYAGGPMAGQLIQKYGIEYVIVSPLEQASVSPNGEFFRQFPVAVQVGQYKVYKVD